MNDSNEKGRQGRTLSGDPAPSEEDELKRKRRSKWTMGEESGEDTEGPSNHPVSRETGTKGESNVGTDELSGNEGVDADPLPPK